MSGGLVGQWRLLESRCVNFIPLDPIFPKFLCLHSYEVRSPSYSPLVQHVGGRLMLSRA